jgi:hypothetical protein
MGLTSLQLNHEKIDNSQIISRNTRRRSAYPVRDTDLNKANIVTQATSGPQIDFCAYQYVITLTWYMYACTLVVQLQVTTKVKAKKNTSNDSS